MTKEENALRWSMDPDYRKQVLRELETKWKIQFPSQEFGDIVFGSFEQNTGEIRDENRKAV